MAPIARCWYGDAEGWARPLRSDRAALMVPGESFEEENRRLREEFAESWQARAMLKAASVFSPRNPTTPR